jgi:hypothetical protein
VGARGYRDAGVRLGVLVSGSVPFVRARCVVRTRAVAFAPATRLRSFVGRPRANNRAFVVPTPYTGGTMQAQPTAGPAASLFLGSAEKNIAFTVDLSPWMQTGESVSSCSVSVQALYEGTATDVTSTLLIGTPSVASNVVTVTLGNANAVPNTTYLVTIKGTTNATPQRVVQTQLPPIPCPA